MPPPRSAADAPSGWLALALDTGTAEPGSLSELARRRPRDPVPDADRASVASTFAPNEVGVALKLARGTAAGRIGTACRLLAVLPDTHAIRVDGHVSVHLAHVADTDVQARTEVRALLPAWLRPGLAGYRRADGAPGAPRDPDAYAALLCRLHPVGSLQLCRERLARTAARTGVRHAVLAVDVTGDPRRSRETIRRLGAEVLPGLRGSA